MTNRNLSMYNPAKVRRMLEDLEKEIAARDERIRELEQEVEEAQVDAQSWREFHAVKLTGNAVMERLLHTERLEQQLKAAQSALGPWTAKTLRQYVADTSEGFECLPGCDSQDHEEMCPVTNTVAAFRLLREQLKAAQAELQRQREKLQSDYIRMEKAFCASDDENDKLKEELKAAQERLAEAEGRETSLLRKVNLCIEALTAIRDMEVPLDTEAAPATRYALEWVVRVAESALDLEYFAKHSAEKERP